MPVCWKYRQRIMAIGVLGLVMLSAGCYYEVRDARTGELYYTDRWVAANGYFGPLTFTDHTGNEVRLQHAEVLRLQRDDYVEATAPEPREP